QPGLLAHRPRGAGRRRRAGRPGRAGADHHHLRRGPAAHPGVRRVRGDEHRRRRDRPDRRGAADHPPPLAGGGGRRPGPPPPARAVQGAGGALVAPAALALITTTFAEGPPRTRAFGVYAAMSIAGGAIGLIGGGLLTTYASWRWVLFVNVPIGAAVALAAPRV